MVVNLVDMTLTGSRFKKEVDSKTCMRDYSLFIRFSRISRISPNKVQWRQMMRITTEYHTLLNSK